MYLYFGNEKAMKHTYKSDYYLNKYIIPIILLTSVKAEFKYCCILYVNNNTQYIVNYNAKCFATFILIMAYSTTGLIIVTTGG